MSRPATRAAAVCSTFRVPPKVEAHLAARFSTAAPSLRASAPCPTTIPTDLASLKNSPSPSTSLESEAGPAPR